MEAPKPTPAELADYLSGLTELQNAYAKAMALRPATLGAAVLAGRIGSDINREVAAVQANFPADTIN